ncbi:MAG: DUF2460 domain-containing protein [Methylovulum sp.]|nr:DUF2460 domain-containing protein [Methylovulum sp.]
MSNEVLPDLPGLTFDMKCNSQFATVIHTPANGQEVRGSFSAYPIWLFSLHYSLLDDNEYADLQALHGFILRRRGSFDSFLYSHPNAHSVSGQTVGTGDGSRTDWPLLRTWGGFTEPVENPNQIDEVTLDGVVADTGSYSVSTAGLLSFSTPPSNGAVIQWGGSYYFRCRFEADLTDFTEFATRIYSHEDFQFRGSPVNKL